MIIKLIVAICLFSGTVNAQQYKTRMIATDNGIHSDTLYLKDYTDSLFRYNGSSYVFAKRELVRYFPAYWQTQGAPTDNAGFTNGAGYLLPADIAGKANLASPTFTGTVAGITAAMVGAATSGHTHAFSEVTSKPTTLSGYGITDALNDDPDFKAYAALGSPFLAQTVGAPIQTANTSTAMVDGQIKFTAVYLQKASTITGIRVYVRVLGAYTGDNNNRVGLYSYSAGVLTLVASSANNASLWTSAANAYQTIAFSSTYAAAAGIYYVGVLYNQSAQTTAPSLASGVALNNAAMATLAFTNSAKLYGTANGTDLTTPINMSAITASVIPSWVALY